MIASEVITCSAQILSTVATTSSGTPRRDEDAEIVGRQRHVEPLGDRRDRVDALDDQRLVAHHRERPQPAAADQLGLLDGELGRDHRLAGGRGDRRRAAAVVGDHAVLEVAGWASAAIAVPPDEVTPAVATVISSPRSRKASSSWPKSWNSLSAGTEISGALATDR